MRAIGVEDVRAEFQPRDKIEMVAALSRSLEAAVTALTDDDLSGLPFTTHRASRTRGIILRNVFVSMGMVILFIMLGVLAITNLATGVILHEGSTVGVVLNASRLLEVPDEMVRVDGGEES